MRTKPEKIKNILVVRTDRFGEFLLNIPAIRALKETFAPARVITVVNPAVAELAQAVPFIDEVIGWPNSKHSFMEKWRMARILKGRKIDIAVMMNPSQEFNLITFLAGIPVRAGYDRKWGFLLNRKIKDLKCLGQKHEVDYNLELVGLLGAKTSERALELHLPKEALGNLFSGLGLKEARDFIVIHPFTSDPWKQWPREYFLDLGLRVAEELKLKVIVVGREEGPGKVVELLSRKTDKIINLIGKTTLVQLAALLKQAKLLVSGDSGPVHLASCAGTPVVAIFRGGIPGKGPVRWGPLSRGSVVVENNDLTQVSSDAIFLKVKEALQKK